jgi:hypothetical protein
MRSSSASIHHQQRERAIYAFLLQAYTHARNQAVELWRFAVPIQALRAAGAESADLAGLIAQHHALAAVLSKQLRKAPWASPLSRDPGLHQGPASS